MSTVPAVPPKESSYDHPEYRNVFKLPLDEEFFDLLQDRLQTCVENILFQGNSQFTLLMNVIPRDEDRILRRDESPRFIYAGLDQQRMILNKNLNKKNKYKKKELKKAWKVLASTKINQEESAVSSKFYEQILRGTYSLGDVCKIETLKEYFSKTIDKYTKEQEAEKIILDTYFDLDNDIFISIPLLGFGEIDGIVHLIFKRDLLECIPGAQENDASLPASIIWILLRAFIVEYDGLFLDWDSVGENVEKTTAIYHFITYSINHVDEYFDRAIKFGKTRLLKDLNLRQYYQKHKDYFTKRLKLGEAIPGKIYQQYLINAVSAILIDSYAHNVSAHALSTLSWWYTRRGKRLKANEVNYEALIEYLEGYGNLNNKVLEDLRKEIRAREIQWLKDQGKDVEKLKKEEEQARDRDGKTVVEYPGSLSREMARLLRFLMEKGAYWSGVMRDTNVGGKVGSLYSILWYDFIRNPLYVGTIAKSEDIQHIRLRIVQYEAAKPVESDKKTLSHHKKIIKDGIFAGVNLLNPRPKLGGPDGTTDHGEVISRFVYMGKAFQELKAFLKKVKVFFPGGVVGKHAFFTMLENEIRNVKHYNHQELKQIQKEGLTVAIGIQPWNLPNSNQKELYRISIWLDTPTRLGEWENHVVRMKWDKLQSGLFTEKFAPKLGGTYQDKVCAAFLLTGKFSSVQSGDRSETRDTDDDTPRDKHFYPWVRPGCSPLEKEEIKSAYHTDFKVSLNNPRTKTNEQEEAPFPQVEISDQLPKLGYLKKIFYVWRGKDLLELNEDNAEEMVGTSSMDNPARFNTVLLNEHKPELKKSLRRQMGVVRIVHGVLQAQDEKNRYCEAYKLWLSELIQQPFYFLQLTENGAPKYQLILDNREDSMRFIYKRTIKKLGSDIDNLIEEMMKDKNVERESNLDIIHGTDMPVSEKFVPSIRYRNHGVYRTRLFPKERTIRQIDDRYAMELFEVLATKVCIFDNRVHHRIRIKGDDDIRAGQRKFMRDKLKLAVHKEVIQKPKALNGKILPGWLSELSSESVEYIIGCHFLVMHLSFIEKILQTEEPNLHPNDTSNVGIFIEKHITPLIGDRSNFFLVVTTGRGRNEWWNTLEKNYEGITLFRPIESLLSAVENSVGMEDDIELKYRIVKILYGS